jgi:hypothetical protein
MYKEIIAKFQGLNVEDIYNDVIKTHPNIADRFSKFNQFTDFGGRTRGQLLEFAVYHFMNQGALFNVMQKGADFTDTTGKFDMKCITMKENEISLSGDTPIGAFDFLPYTTTNVIKKLTNLVMPIVNRQLEIIDVREFRTKELEADLKKDWKVIHSHILANKDGNCNGSHCKYLRAKKRGGKYYIMFTQSRLLNLVMQSHSIAGDTSPIDNKRMYISAIKKQFTNVPSFDRFETDFEKFGLSALYNKYVLKDLNI